MVSSSVAISQRLEADGFFSIPVFRRSFLVAVVRCLAFAAIRLCRPYCRCGLLAIRQGRKKTATAKKKRFALEGAPLQSTGPPPEGGQRGFFLNNKLIIYLTLF